MNNMRRLLDSISPDELYIRHSQKDNNFGELRLIELPEALQEGLSSPRNTTLEL
jgi:hypothetical protein